MRANPSGFTLIELLVAIAIVSILTAVAVASYQDHVATTKRASAKAVLVEAANWIERQYSTNGCYRGEGQTTCPVANASIALPAALSRAPREGARKSYLISAVSNDANAQSFTLSATPCGSANCADTTAGFTDDEFSDSKCNVLTLRHTGEQNVSGASSSATDCWQR